MWKNTEEQWYVLFVKTNNEKIIKERLDKVFSNKLDFFVPKRIMKERRNKKWVFVVRPLFKSYILIKGVFDTEDYYLMKEIPGVYYLIKTEKGPIPLLKEEIESIEKLLKDSDNSEIGISDIYFKGDDVFVANGPLKSLEGIIVSINKRKCRVKVRLSVGGNEKLIDLSINLIKKLQ